MTRAAPIITVTLAALLLLLGTYMGSYYAMLDRSQIDGYIEAGMFVPTPAYRFQHRACCTLFWPAHQIDRVARPQYWEVGTLHFPPISISDSALNRSFRHEDFGSNQLAH